MLECGVVGLYAYTTMPPCDPLLRSDDEQANRLFVKTCFLSCSAPLNTDVLHRSTDSATFDSDTLLQLTCSTAGVYGSPCTTAMQLVDDPYGTPREAGGEGQGNEDARRD